MIAGNLNPVKDVRDGNPDGLRKQLQNCHRDAGSNYIVAAGCEIARGTPAENVMALAEFARCAGGT